MTSWWVPENGAVPVRRGFTAIAAQQMQVAVPIDLHEVELRAFVQRQHLLSALEALRRNKRTRGISHANVVSN